MVQTARRFPEIGLVPALFALALAILAIDPVLWLVRTWQDPSYDSQGGWVALAVAGLFAWSRSSNAPDRAAPETRLAVTLLIGTAVVRLAGQVLAVNTIGAAALVIDVYAIGLLCGLASRRRAVSPGWLALCFAFSLPLERILQRVIGYGLQSLSADGSCILLGALFDNVTCAGIRIVIAGVDVDLPPRLVPTASLDPARCLTSGDLPVAPRERRADRRGLAGWFVAQAASASASSSRSSPRMTDRSVLPKATAGRRSSCRCRSWTSPSSAIERASWQIG